MVNKTGRDNPAIGINRARGGLIALANAHDHAVFHRDIGIEGGLSGSVNHSSVLDE
jgi:hypothetical protein